MIDTHTHIYMPDRFPDGGIAAVDRAVEAGVDMMILPAIDRESVDYMLTLHARRPQNTAVAFGLHPTEVGSDWKAEVEDIMGHTSNAEIVAIGEIGLDLYWEKKYLSRQMDAFGYQLQLAIDLGLPAIVHTRNALEETCEVMNFFRSGLPTLVFHSFTAGIPEAEMLLESAPDAFFGINGVCTFKNSIGLREAITRIDIKRIVTETDSPFLAPVPHRGKINESSFLPHIIKVISEVRKEDEKKVERITVENAHRLFPALRT